MKLLSIIRMIVNALLNAQQRIVIPPLPSGSILDIGGGGEGVIAQVVGSKVIPVDKVLTEIEEARKKAPNALWMVADGTRLPFQSESLDTATAFFSCMYMSDVTISVVICEVQRVLERGGEFWIWDVPMVSKSQVFGIRLLVDTGVNKVRTVYGVKAKDQSVDTLCQSLNQAGFESEIVTNQRHWFLIRARRI